MAHWNSLITAAALACLLPATILAGALDPPAPPAGTMVTLDEIQTGVASAETAAQGAESAAQNAENAALDAESAALNAQDPRTPITALPFTIDTAGSYYLRGDLTATPGSPGILVNASLVDIDLNSFTLDGDGTGLSGILGEAVTPEHTDIVIRNGTIRNWTEDGISLTINPRITIENVRVLDCQRDGITVGDSSQMRGCLISGSGENGLFTGGGCSILECTIQRSFDTGAIVSGESVISQCIIRDNGLGTDGLGTNVQGGGLAMFENCVLERSTISSNRGNTGFITIGFGVFSLGDNVVRECAIHDNATFGLSTSGRVVNNVVTGNGFLGGLTALGGIFSGDGVVTGNSCTDNTGVGISAGNAVVTGNTSSRNTAEGIITTAGGCIIDGNLCTDNDIGISASAGDNLVVRNACFNNTTNDYDAGDGTALPQNPGTNFTDLLIPHPWANFEN